MRDHPGGASMQKTWMEIYRRLEKAFGPQHWWPGETPFEVMTGAILTQNTSWRNVEKALARLKEEKALTPEGIRRLTEPELAEFIRSSGFFRIKARRLKDFVGFLFEEYGGDLLRMRKEGAETLRPKLLKVRGIGPETADSILLYGLGKPAFVVDAYTKRVLARHGWIQEESAPYGEVQALFTAHLPAEERLFNEYHALLVRLAKEYCRKKPDCSRCPLRTL
jgi:endonuclease-3 related protein